MCLTFCVSCDGRWRVQESKPHRRNAYRDYAALFRAAENQGWQPTVEFRVPRRRSVVGTFWYPGVGWTQQLPTPRRAEMGVGIRRQFVSFSIIEGSRQVTPTAADVRAWRKQWPYGVGSPPPRVEPCGELLLEIGDYPSVTTRRRFRDSDNRRIEQQLSGVITAFAKMATGLRADALEDARELRQRALASRRQRDEEVRRKALERELAHLENGMERWVWGQRATDFLSILRGRARGC